MRQTKVKWVNVSHTPFSLLINDVVQEINDLDIGFIVDERSLSMLLSVDDIVVFATTADSLQKMLDVLQNWFKRWRVLINTDKSNCMHFRKGSKKDLSSHI